MRSSKSRSRNKSNRQRSLGNIVNRVFDSSGPEGKVRGTPQQIIEKYLALARDAQLSNDRVAEQSFFQHAEHYTRMLGEAQREMAERQQGQQGQNPRQHGDDDNSPAREGNGREGGHNGNGRDHGGRDQGGRDQSGRDQGGRDHAGRDDVQRDHGQRDHVQRDQNRRHDEEPAEARRDEQSANGSEARDTDQRKPEPRSRTRRAPQAARGTDQDTGPEALPDAVESDSAEKAASFDSHEAEKPKPKAVKPRAPRSTTPRTRRKPSADDTAETGAAASKPADSDADQG